MTSPRSHRPTVRRSTSSASATASCVVSPAAILAALKSNMPHQPSLAAQAMRAAGFGDQNAVEKNAVRVGDGVVDHPPGQVIGGHVGGAFLPGFPAFAPVHFDLDVRHVGPCSYGQIMGHNVPCVNGYFA